MSRYTEAMTAERIEPAILRAIRRVILLIVALGTIGMSLELLLIGHDEDSNQLIPLVVAAAGLLLIAWCAIRPGPFALRAMQLVMLSYIGAGVMGVTLHFKANSEFQLEMDPALGGMDLVWKVVQATAPPALAPGVMVQLGLLGLVYTYKHPALREEEFGVEL